MKKKVGLLLLVLFTLSIFCLDFYSYDPNWVELKESTVLKVYDKEDLINYEEVINELKVTYNNNDIIGIIEIPNILKEVVVQTDNNDYYLHYDLYKNENINGAAFLDYRTNIRESKKLLIYGHSDPYGELPFVKITGYNNKEFMDNNPYIYLTDNKGKRKYEVFSSYVETHDFDYVNLENFGGLSYKDHLEKLRRKSNVEKDIKLSEDTKILILQTCSFDENLNSNSRFQIVVSKEVK